MTKPLRERFMKHVVTGPDCWQWRATTNGAGYGMIYPGPPAKSGTKHLAHRVSWQIFRGDIPDGQHVLHRCDNPECTNPEHLFIGTHRDNMRDKELKGRANHPCQLVPGMRNARPSRAIPKEFHKPPAAPRNGIATRLTPEKTRGTNNPKAKLTDRDVLAIRALHAAGTHPYSALAAQFGVTAGMIGHIVRRMCWTHI